MIADSTPTQTPDELAEIGLAVARIYIKVYRNKLRSVHNIFDDDIESWASKGVMDAILAFDPGRSAKFGAYCRPRIIGAILDGMRARSGHRRTTGSKKIDNAAHILYEQVGLSCDEGRPMLMVDTLPDAREENQEQIDSRLNFDSLIEKISRFDQALGTMLRAVCVDGLTHREAGQMMGRSDSFLDMRLIAVRKRVQWLLVDQGELMCRK